MGEKFLYVAVYECGQCRSRLTDPHWYALYLGDYPRCPHCATYRLTRLFERDRVDAMQTGVLNLAQKILGGRLYHCRYCRLQFYDVRAPVAPLEKDKAAAVETNAPSMAGPFTEGES